MTFDPTAWAAAVMMIMMIFDPRKACIGTKLGQRGEMKAGREEYRK